MKKVSTILFGCILCLSLFLTGCSNHTGIKESTITVAAAASLKNCLDEQLIPAFQQRYPEIKIQTTYDGSGKLQTQIQQGAPIDIFISAAMKQMIGLEEQGLILEDSVVQLLENKIVLIVPKNSTKGINTFGDIIKADRIALGDPGSVPAGQYAEDALTKLKIWEQVAGRSSLGTNVTEVLNWVAQGSADAGIVYSTDAALSKKVKIVAEAPAGTVSKIIYPAGIVKASKEPEAAKKFMEFLTTDGAKKSFQAFGFTVHK